MTQLPFPAMGFAHVGQVSLLVPDTPKPGEDHRIGHYIALLEAAEAAGMRDGTL